MILALLCSLTLAVGLLLGFLAAAILSGSRQAETARELEKLKKACLLPSTKSVSPPPDNVIPFLTPDHHRTL